MRFFIGKLVIFSAFVETSETESIYSYEVIISNRFNDEFQRTSYVNSQKRHSQTHIYTLWTMNTAEILSQFTVENSKRILHCSPIRNVLFQCNHR